WVEVWDGTVWRTFDPTPAGLRPGSGQPSLLRVYATAISDSLNFYWDRYILTFGLGDQVALLINMLSSGTSALAALREAAARVPHLISSPRVLLPAATTACLLLLLVFVIARSRRTTFDLLAHHLAV